jgi:hypothetical protein
MPLVLTTLVFALVLTVLAVVVYALNKYNPPPTTPKPIATIAFRNAAPKGPDLRQTILRPRLTRKPIAALVWRLLFPASRESARYGRTRPISARRSRAITTADGVSSSGGMSKTIDLETRQG